MKAGVTQAAADNLPAQAGLANELALSEPALRPLNSKEFYNRSALHMARLLLPPCLGPPPCSWPMGKGIAGLSRYSLRNYKKMMDLFEFHAKKGISSLVSRPWIS